MSSQDVYEALSRFEEEYIPFRPFVAAADLIDANLKLYRETGIAEHLLVLGESGTGKSSLCSLMNHKHPRFHLPERNVVPILVVSVPPAATIAAVAEAMLERLGDPSPPTGSISRKTARVVTLCRGCGVELVLFDEAQHIHDRGQEVTRYKVADWVKSLIDELGIPTVFLGLPRLEQLTQVNEQLRRRFSRRAFLSLQQSEKDDIYEACLQLFMSLGTCMPLPISAGSFTWKEMGVRLYFASDGRIAYIKKLLAAALRLAMDTAGSEIGPSELERAFTDEVWWQGINELNPFNKAFAFRRLDRGSEPFELGSSATRARYRRRES